MRIRQFLGLLVTVGVLALPATAGAVPPGTFNRLLPHEPGFTAPTDQQLADLAQSMLEPAAFAQPDNGTTFVLGQFLDHDTTLDEEPSPTAPVNIRSLDNTRNARLDLDSVYGDGPSGTPELYEADGKRLRVGVSNGIPDVPRRPDGSAILGDGRNDENLVIVQLHAAFLRAHNRLVDEGRSFAQARLALTRTWQWIVLNEYLPRFVGSVPRVSKYKPGNKHDPVVPVEFAVAAFRFGHSQVRNAYNLNATSAARVVFSFDPAARTLQGGRPVPEDAGIDWRRFFDVPPSPTPAGQFNAGRLVDSFISPPLFALPIPGAAASGSNVLGFRNMIRGKFYALPSYERTARALGVTPVDVETVVGDLPTVFDDETPLWFGLLAEAQAAGGQRLGPTAGRIVNEVFRTNVERDPDGFLGVRGFEPVARSTGELLRFAGVV